jgi:hypothetical protein
MVGSEGIEGTGHPSGARCRWRDIFYHGLLFAEPSLNDQYRTQGMVACHAGSFQA